MKKTLHFRLLVLSTVCPDLIQLNYLSTTFFTNFDQIPKIKGGTPINHSYFLSTVQPYNLIKLS